MNSKQSHFTRSSWARAVSGALLLLGCSTLIGVEDSIVHGPCESRTECAPRYDCLLKSCRNECTSDQQCGAGSRCLKALGTSACIPLGEGCGEGCPESTACIDGACRTSCTVVEDCAGGQQCQGGYCVGTDLAHDDWMNVGVEPGPGGGGTGTGPEPEKMECRPGVDVPCTELEPTLLGNCAEGRVLCSKDGKWGTCDTQPAEQDECAAVGDDANCDGLPNDGCPCVDGTTQSCGPMNEQGECRFGVSSCSGQSWGPCEDAVYPGERDCGSSKDNECDGAADNTVDDQCICEPGTSEPCEEHPGDGNGPCKAGSRTCEPGGATSSWGACRGSVGPGTRDCTDSGDNDCDGKPDSTIDTKCQCKVGAIQVCGAHPGLDGKGPCKAGSQTCVSGSGAATSDWGTCGGSVGPGTETCNNDQGDEDCDGSVNENPPCACINGQTRSCGNCDGGSQTCAGGAWGTCNNNPGPAVTYYRDSDGDGYGNGGIAQSSCYGAPDASWVTNPSDCCDSDARAKPGQTNYYSDKRIVCGGYDYNCDGSDTLEHAGRFVCNSSLYPSCGQLVFSASNGCGASYYQDPSAASCVAKCSGCCSCTCTGNSRTEGFNTCR